MRKHVILNASSILLWVAASGSLAAGPIVTSEGPERSSASSSQHGVTSDGPADSKVGTRIVTSNGPANPAYHYPLPIVVSNGPAQLPYDSHGASAIVVSEGPGKKKIELSDGPNTTGTSALTPVSAFAGASNPLSQTLKAPGERKLFYVYSDKRNSGNHFIPSGWMGDYRDVRLNESSKNNPHSGDTCIQVTYSAKGTQGNGWAGIYWQTPANNWGDNPGGYDLTGMHRLVFWARGEKGGEVVSEFKMGGLLGQHGDSASSSTGSIVLKRGWQKYTMNLTRLNLAHVVGGFCWSATHEDNPNGMTFYLDDIHYE